MTAIATDITSRLARIHETAYWRILLHPTEYDPQRLPTLNDCRRIIEESSVRLRGWNYPQIDPLPDDYVYGNGWIQSGSDFGNRIELWRLYQSGQFIHQRALPGDRFGPRELVSDPRGGQIRRERPLLDFVEVLYTTTELLEFARRLAYRGVLDPAASLTIEIHNVTGRLLVGPPGRVMTEYYTYNSAEPISWKMKQPAQALVAKAPDFALQATIAIIEHFGWLDISRSMLETDQRRFLERRV